MREKAKVSVVLSIYNAKTQHLEESIDSILTQTYQDLEFIIVLNAPKIKEIVYLVERMASQDSRIKIIRNDTLLEICDSYNKGIFNASGEYIALTSADDISLPIRIEQQYAFMESRNLDLSGTDVVYINEESKEVGRKIQPTGIALLKIMPYISAINFSSVMMRKSAFDDIKGFRDIVVEDRDLYLRFMTNGAKIDTLSECLVKYRFSDYQTSSKDRFKRRIIGQYVLRLYKERVKNKSKIDSFTMDELNKFVHNHKGDSDTAIENYDKAYITYLDSLQLLKRKKLRGIIKMTKAFIYYPGIFYNFKVGIISAYFKRRYK